MADTVIASDVVAFASCAEVAVMVTPRSATGALVGAVYVVGVPLFVVVGEIVPHGAVSHATDHVIPLLGVSLETVPVTCAVVRASIVELSTDTLISMPGIAIPACPKTALFVDDVAVSVTP